MTTSLKSKISTIATRSTSPSSDLAGKIDAEAEKYKLHISVGPDYDKSHHQTVCVNGPHAVHIENEFLRAKIKVRIRSYRGLPSSAPPMNPYFNHPLHEKDQYSIAFTFIPKRDLPSADTVWGNDYDHPIRDRLPPGFSFAFRIVKEFIDPGLSMDAYADEPWLYGPSLSCWFAFHVGELYPDGADFPEPDDEAVTEEGADGSGWAVREKHGLPESREKRRKFFLSAANREGFTFEKGRLYEVDFYNPYIDFANFALKLPGFSLKVMKYIDTKTHTLRYVFKNRKTGDMYFNVNFNLLWGEQLEQALEADAEQCRMEAEGQGVVTNGHEMVESVPTKQEADRGKGEVEGVREEEKREQAAAAWSQHHNGKGNSEDAGQISQDIQVAENETRHMDVNEATQDMQLHPGDHSAAAEAHVTESGAEEVTDALRNTSTSDARGQKVNVLEL